VRKAPSATVKGLEGKAETVEVGLAQRADRGRDERRPDRTDRPLVLGRRS
jgi:hypothetical protein